MCPDKNKPLILIVDDNIENLIVMRKILQKLDVVIVEARSGNEALAHTLEHDFAIIVLDVMMPHLDGFEVAEILRNEEKTCHIPIIFVSAINKNITEELKGYKSGAVDFLFKPYNEIIFLNKIRVFLELHKVKTNLEEIVNERTAELKDTNKKLEHKANEYLELSKKLSDTTNFLDNLIEAMPSVLIAINESGIVTKVNQAACAFAGKPLAEIMGKELLEVIPEFLEYKNDIIHVLKERAIKKYYRKTFSFAERRLFDFMIFPIISNNVAGIVIKIDDVTEIEKREMQVRHAQKMETIGNLASGLAHDFNNVLGGITGTLSLIKFKFQKNDELFTKDIFPYLNTIEECGKRAEDMVTQLLTLSRKRKMLLVPVDLNIAIKNVVKVCQNTFDKSVEIKAKYYHGQAVANADATQIEQVLLNLCINAVHSMTVMRKEEKQGGILTISIEKIFPDPQFKISNIEAEEIEYWVLSVKDTGVGMEKDIIPKIFEPFFTTKQDKGTGLGLSMAYDIVHMHNGFINVSSEKGRGSIFKVHLPVYYKVNGVSVSQDKDLFVKGSGLILVVDDEEIMRNLAKSILSECGYDIITAENGEEAVAMYRMHHKNIALVLLDMGMPKKNGKDAFLEMKKINSDIKAIISSGLSSNENIEPLLSIGFKAFIKKPYSISTLSIKIKESIESKSSN